MSNHPGSPPDLGTRPHTDALDQLFGAVRSLGVARPHGGRWFAGVSAGLAERFGLDPLIIRASFILGACLFGAAVPIYLIAWMLLPDDEGRIMVERAVREGHVPSVALSIFLTIVIINGFWIFGSWGSWGLGLCSVIVIGLIVWAIASGHVTTGSFAEGNDFADRLRRGWQSGRWAQSPGNRAAETGATYRTADGGIDLTKHDARADSSRSGVAPVMTRPGPPRPDAVQRRPRLGAVGVLILGAALVAGAVTSHILHDTGHADIAIQIGLAAATAVIGLGLLIGGLLGARGGFLTLIAIPVAAASLLSLAVPTGMPWTGETGNRVWTPTSVGVGHQHNFALVAGDGTLDLGSLDTAALDQHRITARVNLGNLKVVVPANLTVHFRAKVDMGSLKLPRPVLAKSGDGSNPCGTGIKRSFTVGSGHTDLTVDAHVGIGELTVESR